MNEGVWNRKNHYRFRRKDRTFVLFLLWFQKNHSIPKDVWIVHIIPYSIDQLNVPYILVTNLSFEYDKCALKLLLDVPINEAKIALRRNDKSKGFGFFKCVKYDDYKYFIKLRVADNGLVFSKTTEREVYKEKCTV